MKTGELIKVNRKTIRGVSLKELSEATGIPIATLSEYESGRYKPNFTNVCKIAAALSTDIHYLVGDDPSDKSLRDCLDIIFGLNAETSKILDKKTWLTYDAFTELKRKLAVMGFVITFSSPENSGEKYINVQYPDTGEVIKISQKDIDDLIDNSDSFLRFQMDELRRKKQSSS